MEMPGIEPGAFHMQSERSTTELHPLLFKVSLFYLPFFPLSPTALKILYRHCQQRLIFFTNVGDSAKKYKTRFSSLSIKILNFFSLVPVSPSHTGLICVKWSRISQAWATLKKAT
jgi:hypothetical protein